MKNDCELGKSEHGINFLKRSVHAVLKLAYDGLTRILSLAFKIGVLLVFISLQNVLATDDTGNIAMNNSPPREAIIKNSARNLSVFKRVDKYMSSRNRAGTVSVENRSDEKSSITIEDAIEIRNLVSTPESASFRLRGRSSLVRNSDLAIDSSIPNKLEGFPQYRKNLLNFASRERIYFGSFDQENNFPAVVLLPGLGNQNCSGTVVGRRWVITAAHCACKVGFDKIYYGRSKRESAWIGIEEGPYYFDSSICPDGQWQKEYGKRDIALYKLKDDFPGSPQKLSILDHMELTKLTIAGFGQTEFNPDGGFKFHAEVPVASEKCSPDQLDDRGLSAPVVFNCIENVELVAASESLKDTCRGDSGGPALLKTTEGGEVKYTLAGVTSRGTENQCGFGGIYVRITSDIANWINACVSSLVDHCLQPTASVMTGDSKVLISLRDTSYE